VATFEVARPAHLDLSHPAQPRAHRRGEGAAPSVSALAETARPTDRGLDRFNARGGWAAPPAAWAEERPDVLASRAELLALTTAAIDELPERQRTVVLLRDVHGWTSEEVCNAMDLAETNQRVLLHRARAQIRAAVAAALSPEETRP
jgi:RNA polymerase sigma-70 factor (ECF subfamily)